MRRCCRASRSAHGAAVGQGRSPEAKRRDQLVDGPRPAASVVVPGVEDLQEDPLRPACRSRRRSSRRCGAGRAPARCRRSCRRMVTMFASVVTRGCWPVCTAYCSAGRPNASKPIACSTLWPRHPLEAAVDVGRDVAQRVPDVQPDARTGKGTCPARTASVAPLPCPGRPAGRTGWAPRRCPRSSQRSCHRDSISAARPAA